MEEGKTDKSCCVIPGMSALEQQSGSVPNKKKKRQDSLTAFLEKKINTNPQNNKYKLVLKPYQHFYTGTVWLFFLIPKHFIPARCASAASEHYGMALPNSSRGLGFASSRTEMAGGGGGAVLAGARRTAATGGRRGRTSVGV